MDTAGKELTKKLLEEGKRYDDVRRAVISHGYSTEHFEEEYQQLVDELGIKEPKPTSVDPVIQHSVTNDEAREAQEAAIQKKRKLMVNNAFKVVVGCIVLAAAVILLSGYGTELKQKFIAPIVDEGDSSLTPADVSLSSNLRTMQVAAEVYHSKLSDYSGLCKSVGIDQSLYNCVESNTAYAIEGRLSNNRFFCVDSTGFADVVEVTHGGDTSCPK